MAETKQGRALEAANASLEREFDRAMSDEIPEWLRADPRLIPEAVRYGMCPATVKVERGEIEDLLAKVRDIEWREFVASFIQPKDNPLEAKPLSKPQAEIGEAT